MDRSTAPSSGAPTRRRLGLAAGASALLAGCSPAAVLNALAADRLVADGVAFGPDQRQRLDVYRPPGSGPFPVAMFVYGGDWQAGNRATYRFVGAALAGAGFLTVVPDYRLYPAVRYPAFLQDNARALRWTRQNAARFGGDPARVPALIGHSAGAYNVAMLTLDRRWLADFGLEPARDIGRAVGLAGPYDFLPFGTAMLRDLFAPAPTPADTQPITYADGHAPPMLLLAGRADRTVDPANSVRLATRIRERGGLASAELYPGVDHREIIGAFAPALRFLAPSLADSVRFMRA